MHFCYYLSLRSLKKVFRRSLLVGIYMIKVKWRRSGVFIVNFEHIWRRSGAFIVNLEYISHLVLVFLLLTLRRQMPTGLYRLQNLFEVSQRILKIKSAFFFSIKCFETIGYLTLVRLDFLKVVFPKGCQFNSPFIFEGKLILYQYHYIQLLNNLLKVG